MIVPRFMGALNLTSGLGFMAGIVFKENNIKI
jgi:hypothetical protein